MGATSGRCNNADEQAEWRLGHTDGCVSLSIVEARRIGRDDMAKLVFGLNQSPDGYIDRQEFTPMHSLGCRHK